MTWCNLVCLHAGMVSVWWWWRFVVIHVFPKIIMQVSWHNHRYYMGILLLWSWMHDYGWMPHQQFCSLSVEYLDHDAQTLEMCLWSCNLWHQSWEIKTRKYWVHTGICVFLSTEVWEKLQLSESSGKITQFALFFRFWSMVTRWEVRVPQVWILTPLAPMLSCR